MEVSAVVTASRLFAVSSGVAAGSLFTTVLEALRAAIAPALSVNATFSMATPPP